MRRPPRHQSLEKSARLEVPRRNRTGWEDLTGGMGFEATDLQMARAHWGRSLRTTKHACFQRTLVPTTLAIASVLFLLTSDSTALSVHPSAPTALFSIRAPYAGTVFNIVRTDLKGCGTNFTMANPPSMNLSSGFSSGKIRGGARICPVNRWTTVLASDEIGVRGLNFTASSSGNYVLSANWTLNILVTLNMLINRSTSGQLNRSTLSACGGVIVGLVLIDRNWHPNAQFPGHYWRNLGSFGRCRGPSQHHTAIVYSNYPFSASMPASLLAGHHYEVGTYIEPTVDGHTISMQTGSTYHIMVDYNATLTSLSVY